MNKIAIQKAAKRIRPYILETPLLYSPFLSKATSAKVYLKLESEQVTGSFKIRGAFNKLLSLTSNEKRHGIITASTGNHGAAVAYGMQKLNIKGTIYLPNNASAPKVEAIKYYGPDIEFYGDESVDTEIRAREVAEKKNKVFISPYNDPEIIAGQGTVGLEIANSLPNIDAVFVPVGGGGLIAGIASYMKQGNHHVRIFGCEPAASAVMAASIRAGKVLQMKTYPTLSNATAGGMESDAITFGVCKRLVDGYYTLTENEIGKAVFIAITKLHKVFEGAGALPVAALFKNRKKFQNKTVVLVVSGSNLATGDLKRIVCSA